MAVVETVLMETAKERSAQDLMTMTLSLIPRCLVLHQNGGTGTVTVMRNPSPLRLFPYGGPMISSSST